MFSRMTVKITIKSHRAFFHQSVKKSNIVKKILNKYKQIGEYTLSYQHFHMPYGRITFSTDNAILSIKVACSK